MNTFVDIKPGQWALAFFQPFGPYFREMPEHLEGFARRGGGWDNCEPAEIFQIHQIVKVMPKTYISSGNKGRYVSDGDRLDRLTVIAAGSSREKMIELRDKLYAIGVETSDAIETEMYRRIAKFAERKEAQAQKRIHRMFPEIFGREA